MKKLNHFHTTCLRKIVGITWQKDISSIEVVTRASLPSIFMQSRLRWAVVCIKDHRLPKKLLYSELSQGKRPQADEKKGLKDTLNVSMKSFAVTSNSLNYMVQDRNKEREVVKRGAKACEARRNVATKLCRKLRKGITTLASAAAFPYSHYPRLCRAQISLIKHPVLNHRLIRWFSSITTYKDNIFHYPLRP